MFKSAVKRAFDVGGDWVESIKYICSAYNKSEIDGYGYSPYCLMRGFEPRMPPDVILGAERAFQEITEGLDAHVIKKMQLLRAAYKFIQDKRLQRMQKAKAIYDQKVKMSDFPDNCEVIVWSPRMQVGISKKLLYQWVGPAKVLGKASQVNFDVQLPSGRVTRVHVSRLRRYCRDKLGSAELDIVPDIDRCMVEDLLGGVGSEIKNMPTVIEGPMRGVSQSDTELLISDGEWELHQHLLQNEENPKRMTRQTARARYEQVLANRHPNAATSKATTVSNSTSSESCIVEATARARNTATTHQEHLELGSAVEDQHPPRSMVEVSPSHIRNRHGGLVRIVKGSMCTGRSAEESETKVMKHVDSDSEGNLTVEVWGKKDNGKYFPVWVDSNNKTRIAANGKANEKKWLWEVEPNFIREYGFQLKNRQLPDHISLSEKSSIESESTNDPGNNNHAVENIDNLDTEVECTEAVEAAVNLVSKSSSNCIVS